MDTERKNKQVSTAIILETRVKNKANLHPVKLRVIYQRKYKQYALKKEFCSIDEFSEIFKEGARGKNKEKKRQFEAFENRAIDIIDNVLDSFSFEAFENEFLTIQTKDNSIQSFFDNKSKELDSLNKIQTATLYRATIKSLLEYDKNISFDKITPKYLKKYETWMLSDEKNNSYTTLGMYLRNLKHIINLALEKRIVKKYPFGKTEGLYQIPKGKTTKKALTISEIDKLFKYEPENRNEFIALNYWLFSYLCNGMNMVDIANLKFKDIKGNNFEFIRQKTKDTSNEIPLIIVYLLPEIKEIIEKLGNENKEPDNYIFPIFQPGYSPVEKHKRLKQHIKNTNKYIRKIAKKIGLDENITTYWARHTYSTVLKRSGTTIEFISEQLGHQSTKVTKNYLDSFEDEQRAENAKKLIPGKA
jgi:integrase/recombinase XerD